MCVFFRKYTCGVLVLCGDIKKLCSVQFILFVLRQFLLYFVDVLDKGCGVINVQSYVGCRGFDMVKSYLCLSVPVLDDDCGAFVHFVYDDGIIDDELFQGLSLLIC